MQILSLIVFAGIVLVILYLFLRKLFNEDRLKFPDEKKQPEGKYQEPEIKQPAEETPLDSDGKQEGPVEKPAEPAEEHDESFNSPPGGEECTDEVPPMP